MFFCKNSRFCKFWWKNLFLIQRRLFALIFLTLISKMFSPFPIFQRSKLAKSYVFKQNYCKWHPLKTMSLGDKNPAVCLSKRSQPEIRDQISIEYSAKWDTARFNELLHTLTFPPVTFSTVTSSPCMQMRSFVSIKELLECNKCTVSIHKSRPIDEKTLVPLMEDFIAYDNYSDVLVLIEQEIVCALFDRVQWEEKQEGHGGPYLLIWKYCRDQSTGRIKDNFLKNSKFLKYWPLE